VEDGKEGDIENMRICCCPQWRAAKNRMKGRKMVLQILFKLFYFSILLGFWGPLNRRIFRRAFRLYSFLQVDAFLTGNRLATTLD
jgi:hypothetical protein